MSAELHLVCLDHIPPLLSDTVGNYLGDLTQVRTVVRHHVALRECLRYADLDAGSTVWAAVSFCSEHPHCRIEIHDDNGHTHALSDAERASERVHEPDAAGQAAGGDRRE